MNRRRLAMALLKSREREDAAQEPAAKGPDMALTKKVIGQVMTALGLPPGWVLTKATNTFDNNWRVDVWAKKPDPNGVQCLVRRNAICDSFFVRADDEGKIVRSSPEITKKYE